jgi:hypothetical protein
MRASLTGTAVAVALPLLLAGSLVCAAPKGGGNGGGGGGAIGLKKDNGGGGGFSTQRFERDRNDNHNGNHQRGRCNGRGNPCRRHHPHDRGRHHNPKDG